VNVVHEVARAVLGAETEQPRLVLGVDGEVLDRDVAFLISIVLRPALATKVAGAPVAGPRTVIHASPAPFWPVIDSPWVYVPAASSRVSPGFRSLIRLW